MAKLTKESFLAGSGFIINGCSTNTLYYFDGDLLEKKKNGSKNTCIVTYVSEEFFCYSFLFLGNIFHSRVFFINTIIIQEITPKRQNP